MDSKYNLNITPKKEEAHPCMKDAGDQKKKIDRPKQTGEKSTSSSTKPQTDDSKSSKDSNANSISLTMNEKLREKSPPTKKEARQYQGDASLSDQGNYIDRGKKDKDKKNSDKTKEPQSSEPIKKKGKTKVENSKSTSIQKPSNML